MGRTQSINAFVIGEVPLGNYSYYIVESGTTYYKSTITSPRSIPVNSTISINFKSDGLYNYFNLSNEEVFFQALEDDDSQTIPDDITWILPEMREDILFFENESHLLEFQDKVNNYLTGFSGAIQEVQMNKIMSNFGGFYSFNQHIIDHFDFVDREFTEKDIEDLSEIDFVNDPILKNLLNSHRVLGIGSDVHGWYSTDLIISLPVSSLPSLKAKLYDTFEDARMDPWDPMNDLFRSDDVIYTSDTKTKKPKLKNILSIDPTLVYQSIPTAIHIVESCNKLKKAIKMEVFETITYGSGANISTDHHRFAGTVNLIIDWGDGSSQTVSNYSHTTQIEHTYSSEGNFYPIVKTLFTNYYGQASYMYDGTYAPTTTMGTGASQPAPIDFVTNQACSESDKQLYKSKIVGSYGLEAKIWVNHNLFGHHIGSYTHSWKQKNNGKWVRKIANIYTNIYGTFRNDECVITETKSGSDTENQERVQVTVNKALKKYKAAGNNSIYSEHHLSKDGTYIALALTLTPCP
ncbi:MAG: hypothetical protein ACO1N0_16900 [Fluviicola sp.]